MDGPSYGYHPEEDDEDEVGGCLASGDQGWLDDDGVDAVGRCQPPGSGDPDEVDDPFELEMSAELDERVHRAEQDGGLRSSASVNSGSGGVGGGNRRRSGGGGTGKRPAAAGSSDALGLDSDDDDDDEDMKLPQPSNDELLFDPEMDNQDQKWADKIRMSH